MDSKSSGLSISSLAAGGSCQRPRSPPGDVMFGRLSESHLCIRMVCAVEFLMFRKEVGLNRWLNVSGVTWANWLPRSLCSETLAIFSWQQPHAGACTFASKHIGRLDSKNMQKWYHLKNRFGKSIKKNNGSIATNQGPLNHDESCFFSGHIGSSLPHLYSWAEWRHGMGWDSSMAWKKHSSVPFGKKSGFPTTSNNKPAKIGESTGFMANFGYVSGMAYVTRVVFWNPTRLNLGTSSMMWQTGPAAQTFWCSQSAGRLSALDFPGNMWLLESIWEHLKTL